jgi:hypothetical protein
MITTDAATNVAQQITQRNATFKDISADPTFNLNNFKLDDLAIYTPAKSFDQNDSQDFKLFQVGQDDVHGILKHIISRASISLSISMFGFADEELNDIIWQKIKDPNIFVQISLDSSQAAGVGERKILDKDKANDLTAFNTHFTIGQSATHQIRHTKGGVIDGKVGFEGSTNWSTSGEGTFVPSGNGSAGGVGYKAQDNTLTVFTNPVILHTFLTTLQKQHNEGVKGS